MLTNTQQNTLLSDDIITLNDSQMENAQGGGNGWCYLSGFVTVASIYLACMSLPGQKKPSKSPAKRPEVA